MTRCQTHSSPPARGFTIIELMVVVAIAVLLLSIAVPGFRELMASQRVKTVSYEIVSDLTLARSEALKRGQDVSLAPAEGGWAAGWSVTTAVTTPTAAIVQLSQKNPVGTGVTFTTSPGTVTFDLNGRIAGATTVTRFGLTDGRANRRCISLDPSGRPKRANTECPT
ncbi:MAG TPA: GspH/FimT family pseudopilin [Burkholderiaceae bacterium]|nr:GspH/FimT family pseudopilin [Burkholderiaceae bacterium]